MRPNPISSTRSDNSSTSSQQGSTAKGCPLGHCAKSLYRAIKNTFRPVGQHYLQSAKKDPLDATRRNTYINLNPPCKEIVLHGSLASLPGSSMEGSNRTTFSLPSAHDNPAEMQPVKYLQLSIPSKPIAATTLRISEHTITPPARQKEKNAGTSNFNSWPSAVTLATSNTQAAKATPTKPENKIPQRKLAITPMIQPSEPQRQLAIMPTGKHIEEISLIEETASVDSGSQTSSTRRAVQFARVDMTGEVTRSLGYESMSMDDSIWTGDSSSMAGSHLMEGSGHGSTRN